MSETTEEVPTVSPEQQALNDKRDEAEKLREAIREEQRKQADNALLKQVEIETAQLDEELAVLRRKLAEEEARTEATAPEATNEDGDSSDPLMDQVRANTETATQYAEAPVGVVDTNTGYSELDEEENLNSDSEI